MKRVLLRIGIVLLAAVLLASARHQSAAAAPDLKIAAGGCDAVLATAKGKVNAAFNWSKTYGKEFGDAAKAAPAPSKP